MNAPFLLYFVCKLLYQFRYRAFLTAGGIWFVAFLLWCFRIGGFLCCIHRDKSLFFGVDIDVFCVVLFVVVVSLHRVSKNLRGVLKQKANRSFVCNKNKKHRRDTKTHPFTKSATAWIPRFPVASVSGYHTAFVLSTYVTTSAWKTTTSYCALSYMKMRIDFLA
jgi:hypothetical protein